MNDVPDNKLATGNDGAFGRMPKRLGDLLPKLLILVPVGIIANVAYCLLSFDKQLLGSFVHFHPLYLAGATLLGIVPWFTSSLRLFVWCRFLGLPIPYRESLGISIAADLGAAIAPPSIGGSGVKVAMLLKRGMETGKAISLPVLENLEDIVFFLIMVPIGLVISAEDLPRLSGLFRIPHFPWAVVTFLAAVVTFLLVLARFCKFQTRVMAAIRSSTLNFLGTFRLIGQGGKRFLVATLFLTMIQWICRYSIISLLLAGLGVPVRPVLYLVLQVFVFAIVTVVPSPGGAGGAEFIFSILYNPFLPAGTAGMMTAVWRFFTFYLQTLLAAALFLLFGSALLEKGRDGKRWPSPTSPALY